MIKYLGSKRLLLPQLCAAAQAFGNVKSVLDLFSGTSRVGHALKKAGFHVTANDHNTYAHTLGRCYVQANRDTLLEEVSGIIDELNEVPGKPGYFTQTFCEESRYFMPKNGARVDAIRARISEMSVNPVTEAVLLTSLMEAADRVDSTTGVQMAYLKKWASRANNDLKMRVPDIVSGEGRATHSEAIDAASEDVDLVYLDPPYNQHSYIGNYHIWETLVRADEPEHYGIACKRVSCRTHKSSFNSKPKFRDAFAATVAAIKSKQLLVSFNNEGFLDRGELVEILSNHGHVGVVDVDYQRYVGAKIGIYNPSGKKVGKVSHVKNKEHLFVVAQNQRRVDKVCKAITNSL